MYKERNFEFIRVGVKYFKIIDKKNSNKKVTKMWQKQILLDDYGKDKTNSIIKEMDKFDDFTIEPNNFKWSREIDGDYNLYYEFKHKPVDGRFDTIHKFMEHIFGEQLELGYQYLKILYEQPKLKLPVLVLASKDEGTGKSTFMEFISFIFGDNCVKSTVKELNGNFNEDYARANIVTMEEVMMEDKHTVEKLKALVTDEYLSVNEKFMSKYSVKSYLKLIMATNNEDNFARLTGDASRFWVRKINKFVGRDEGTVFRQKLRAEVPALLYYLLEMNEVPINGRLVFSPEQIRTDALDIVKEHSKGTLYNDLKEHMEDLFLNSDREIMYATPKQLKERFFKGDNRVGASYIKRVLVDAFGMKLPNGAKKKPILDAEKTIAANESVGRFFEFHREDFVGDYVAEKVEEDDLEPF